MLLERGANENLRNKWRRKNRFEEKDWTLPLQLCESQICVKF